MKLKSPLAASLFAIAAVLSLNASAASDTPADAKTEKVEAKKTVKPHSHMEEKMGMTSNTKEAAPEQAASATSTKAKPAKKKTNHLHPRDGGKL